MTSQVYHIHSLRTFVHPLTNSKKPTKDYEEAFLASLGNAVANSSASWPTVRFWTNSSLKKLFREIHSRLKSQGIGPKKTNKFLLDWFLQIGIRKEVSVDGELFHLLEMGGDSNPQPDPLELLMAVRPSGAICYFSSLAFHSLTTQPIPHHHVAVIEKNASSPSEKPVGDNLPCSTQTEPEDRTQRSNLGKLLFRFEEVPYYLTRRSARTIPGIQFRTSGHRTSLRITSLEQALLDCIYKPIHCGGPEVVFEAWQEAHQSKRIDEENMAELLNLMNYPAVTRRTAVICDLIGFNTGQALSQLFLETYKTMNRESEFARISLLPGIDYKTLDQKWLVYTP